tara:strand:+ start:1609 stop:1935 length:327 start_codon:yes stop_codon:yes gene_type:complete
MDMPLEEYKQTALNYRVYTTMLRDACLNQDCQGPRFIEEVTNKYAGRCKHVPYSRQLYFVEITKIRRHMSKFFPELNLMWNDWAHMLVKQTLIDFTNELADDALKFGY